MPTAALSETLKAVQTVGQSAGAWAACWAVSRAVSRAGHWADRRDLSSVGCSAERKVARLGWPSVDRLVGRTVGAWAGNSVLRRAVLTAVP